MTSPQTPSHAIQTTRWISRENRLVLGQLRSLLDRKFPSLRVAAESLGKSHNYLNSVLSGRTRLKLPGLLRILRIGRSSLVALQSELSPESSSPLCVLEHLCQRPEDLPVWYSHFLDRLAASTEAATSDRPDPFQTASYEIQLYDSPKGLIGHLNQELRSEPAKGIWLTHELIRRCLLWTRARSAVSPGGTELAVILRDLHRAVGNRSCISWLRPEIDLAIAHCISDLAPLSVSQAIQRVVHSAVMEDHITPLVGALLLDAETALQAGRGPHADRNLRSLVRYMRTVADEESLSDSTILPPATSSQMFWLEQSPAHYARLMIASAWRHLLTRNYSKALNDLDALDRALSGGLAVPSFFLSQASWLRAAVARDTGRLPEMDLHLESAAEYDRDSHPVRSALAQLRRLSYLWNTGQRDRFQAALHQDLGLLAQNLVEQELVDLIVQCRREFTRGRLDPEILREAESGLDIAVEKTTPW